MEKLPISKAGAKVERGKNKGIKKCSPEKRASESCRDCSEENPTDFLLDEFGESPEEKSLWGKTGTFLWPKDGVELLNKKKRYHAAMGPRQLLCAVKRTGRCSTQARMQYEPKKRATESCNDCSEGNPTEFQLDEFGESPEEKSLWGKTGTFYGRKTGLKVFNVLMRREADRLSFLTFYFFIFTFNFNREGTHKQFDSWSPRYGLRLLCLLNLLYG
ncbi:hypothetical protein CEXT_47121 [Caerostris extrusa]|uniref:Uncharacterized protein n=1 Tax=Caerostris extrusa TaxID=172846 RepID=A0AAV4XLY8_CAEEX|nr:hypothetical protein CEXT_47121 [Caerostris extrusa]